MSQFINIFVLAFLCKTVAGDFFDICGGREDGLLLKDYSSCERYFMCDHGIALPVTCPHGYHFNSETSVCRPKAEVACKVCSKSDSYIERLPQTCTGYVRCFGGMIYYEQCPEGYLFSEKSQTCQDPSRVECVVERCRENEANDVFASKFDCAMYYTCVNGTAKKTNCPAGQQYDANKKECDSAKNVKCHIPVVLAAADDIPDMTISCPPTGILLYPHPLSCSSYFVCIDGKSTAYTCSTSLVYDFSSKSCKAPLDAKCIKSLI